MYRVYRMYVWMFVLHSLTIEWMCGCRGGGVNMITDVLYNVNLYILFCVKRFELSHVMDIALYKCYVLLLLCMYGWMDGWMDVLHRPVDVIVLVSVLLCLCELHDRALFC